MKKSILTTLFLAIVCLTIQAQKNPFIRIYNLNGKKIMKGNLFNLTDSSLTLLSEGKNYEIPYQNIGTIKEGRSIGNSIGTASLTGGVLLGILGATVSSGQNGFSFFTPAETGLVGLITGGAGGALLGTGTYFLKNRKTFIINANKEFWLKAKVELEKLGM